MRLFLCAAITYALVLATVEIRLQRTALRESCHALAGSAQDIDSDATKGSTSLTASVLRDNCLKRVDAL
jgi:hypothetical protein